MIEIVSLSILGKRKIQLHDLHINVSVPNAYNEISVSININNGIAMTFVKFLKYSLIIEHDLSLASSFLRFTCVYHCPLLYTPSLLLQSIYTFDSNLC